MKEQNIKMLNEIRTRPALYLDRLAAIAAAAPESEDRMAIEAQRCRVMLANAAVPDACGPDIAPSPARGGFALHRNVELLPVGTDKFEAVHRGYGGRAAIRRADVFDAMIAAALRAKRDVMPLSPGQIAIGRRYHDLVQMLSSDGTKLSQLEGSFGSGDSGNWMDQRLALSSELAGMRRRIGTVPALQVRRIRRSHRGDGPSRIFTARDIVDMVCIEGRGIKQVLAHFDWQPNGRNCKAVAEALSDALNRMIGYRPQKSS